MTLEQIEKAIAYVGADCLIIYPASSNGKHRIEFKKDGGSNLGSAECTIDNYDVEGNLIKDYSLKDAITSWAPTAKAMLEKMPLMKERISDLEKHKADWDTYNQYQNELHAQAPSFS